MRFLLRFLGTDLLEIHLGRCSAEAVVDDRGPGGQSADLSVPFGFTPIDETEVE